MLSFLGDLSLNGLISDDPEQNTRRFADVAAILNSSELVFANLEVPVKGDETANNNSKLVYYSLPRPTKEILRMLNIGIVSLANNHIYDYKMPGLSETINTLDELGIYHTGAGWKQEHIHPVLINVHGSRIGFLAYVDASTNPVKENSPELLLNYFEPEKVKKSIIELRSKADMVICSIHWGKDYSNFYTEAQRKIAQEIIDAGADIIMGHHPHTVQPVEKYKGRFIFYSLGSLCYGDFYWEGKLRALKRKTKLGMIAMFEINEGIKKIIPTKELKGNSISVPNTKIEQKLRRLMWWNILKNKYLFIHYVIKAKESIVDRFWEYFFGYYRNAFKQLFSIGNLKKAGYITRDFKS